VTLLKRPDDAVLRQILMKLLQDRQLKCSDDVIDYALARMERSARFAMDLAEALDQASMASQKPITKKMVSQSVDALFSEISDLLSESSENTSL
jgi:chromosomal replication initiation ATPase DnaA